MFTLLFVVVILMATANLIFLFVTRDDTGTVAAASQAANQITAVKGSIEAASPADQGMLIRRLDSPTMRVAITPMPLVSKSDNKYGYRVVRRELEKELPVGTEIRADSQLHIADPSVVTRDRFRRGAVPFTRGSWRRFAELSPEKQQMLLLSRMKTDQAQFYPAQGVFRASIRIAKHRWFNAHVILNLGDVPKRPGPAIFVSIVMILVALGALIAVSRALRPLAVFAGAAERLGMDVRAEPLDESGPREVRRATRAFNQMQERLQRFIQDRARLAARAWA